MIAQYIQLGDRDWNVLIYYNVSKEDFVEIADSLMQLDCPEEEIRKAFKTLRRKKWHPDWKRSKNYLDLQIT